MTRAIVCGIDGSPDSQGALAYATELADQLGARLVLAHVVEPAPIRYATIGPIAGAAPPSFSIALARASATANSSDPLNFGSSK